MEGVCKRVNKEKAKKWLTALALIVVGVIVAAGVARLQIDRNDPANSIFRDYYNEVGWDRAPDHKQLIWMGISDGCMVIGALYVGMGLLTWIATTGFFDMLAYGFSSLWVMFTPFKDPKDHPRFSEYKQKRQEKRSGTKTMLLLVGLLFLALAAAAAGMYYI